MRKRLTVGALLATVMLFAVVLVSGSQAMVGGSVPDSAKKLGAAKVTTVSLNGWVGAKVEDDLLKEVIAAFERSHPNIKVDYSGFNNYQTTMLAKFSARQPPDVFYVAAEDFADWVRQGVLQPLDAYAKKTKFSTKPFYTGLANSFKYKGKTYGYPKDWSSLGMQVNPALLNGQRVPTDVGAASVRRAEDQHRGRQADLPRSGLGAPDGVRLPGGRNRAIQGRTTRLRSGSP